MSPLRKVFAVAVSAGILGAQAIAILPPGTDDTWYWPFIGYPMYSDARSRGDVVAQHRLWGLPCGSNTAYRVITPEDLRAGTFNVIYILRALVAQQSRDHRLATRYPASDGVKARHQVEAMVALYSPGVYCRLKVQEQAVSVGSPVPANVDSIWIDLVEWVPEAKEKAP